MRPYYSPPGTFIWCNNTIFKNLSASLPSNLCLLVTLVPPLTIYSPGELAQGFFTSPPNPSHLQKRAAFLPVVAGISLTASLVSAGLSAGALIHSTNQICDLTSHLQLAIEALTESLAALQRQITSLAQVILQNRRALDLLTAEKGDTCLFLRKECCYFINESGIVETQVTALYKLSTDLQR